MKMKQSYFLCVVFMLLVVLSDIYEYDIFENIFIDDKTKFIGEFFNINTERNSYT